MGVVYRETIALCPDCACDCSAHYEERDGFMWLDISCMEHGDTSEMVECDIASFKHYYEQEYLPPHRHLVLPVTYRCDLNCRYCYSLSNAGMVLPPDRSFEQLFDYMGAFDGNITLIGGEPTVRRDLPELIRRGKSAFPGRRISVATNGQRLSDLDYAETLQDAKLDFVFLSFNDVSYEPSPEVYRRKLQALENCGRIGMPVWLQRTVDDINQIDSLLPVIETYRKVVFEVTLRAIKPLGATYPTDNVCVSQIVDRLGVKNDVAKGTNPFNRRVMLAGRPVKVCSWVNDVRRVDPLDSAYVISTDEITTFHRGIKMDEVILKRRSVQLPAEPTSISS